MTLCLQSALFETIESGDERFAVFRAISDGISTNLPNTMRFSHFLPEVVLGISLQAAAIF